MAWNTHPTVVVGQTWSASDENTYVKGNLDTLFPYTAANQLAYSNSTNSLATISSTAAFLVVRSNSANSGIEFGMPPIIRKRQGQSTTNWLSTTVSTLSNQNITPLTSAVQTGYAQIASGSTITFPVTFAYNPIIICQILSSDTVYGYPSGISSSKFIYTHNSTASQNVVWLAAGDL